MSAPVCVECGDPIKGQPTFVGRHPYHVRCLEAREDREAGHEVDERPIREGARHGD